MHRLILATSLLLLMRPALGLAQQAPAAEPAETVDALDAPVAGAVAPDAGNPSEAVDAPDAGAPRPTSAAPTTGLGGAVLGGATATALMVGGTALTAYALSHDCPDDLGSALQCAFDATNAVISLSAFAYAPAIALGAWAGGRVAGGQGRYDFTLLGASLGTAAGYAALAALAATDSDPAFGFGMALLPLLQLTGAVVAYGLSARAEASHRDRRLGPVLSADRHGGMLGLAGVF